MSYKIVNGEIVIDNNDLGLVYNPEGNISPYVPRGYANDKASSTRARLISDGKGTGSTVDHITSGEGSVSSSGLFGDSKTVTSSPSVFNNPEKYSIDNNANGGENISISDLIKQNSGNAAGSGLFGVGTQNQWDTGLAAAGFGMNVLNYLDNKKLKNKQIKALDENIKNAQFDRNNTKNYMNSYLSRDKQII